MPNIVYEIFVKFMADYDTFLMDYWCIAKICQSCGKIFFLLTVFCHQVETNILYYNVKMQKHAKFVNLHFIWQVEFENFAHLCVILIKYVSKKLWRIYPCNKSFKDEILTLWNLYHNVVFRLSIKVKSYFEKKKNVISYMLLYLFAFWIMY